MAPAQARRVGIEGTSGAKTMDRTKLKITSIRAKNLHPKVGKQAFLLDGVLQYKDLGSGRAMISLSRPAMERLWRLLNDLQEVAMDFERREPSPRAAPADAGSPSASASM